MQFSVKSNWLGQLEVDFDFQVSQSTGVLLQVGDKWWDMKTDQIGPFGTILAETILSTPGVEHVEVDPYRITAKIGSSFFTPEDVKTNIAERLISLGDYSQTAGKPRLQLMPGTDAIEG